MNRDIADIRRDYQLASLDEATSMEHPMEQFTICLLYTSDAADE